MGLGGAGMSQRWAENSTRPTVITNNKAFLRKWSLDFFFNLLNGMRTFFRRALEYNYGVPVNGGTAGRRPLRPADGTGYGRVAGWITYKTLIEWRSGGVDGFCLATICEKVYFLRFRLRLLTLSGCTNCNSILGNSTTCFELPLRKVSNKFKLVVKQYR